MGAHDALFNICAKRKKKITVCCNKRLTHELLASPEMAPANGRRQDAIYTRSTIFSKTELPKRKCSHEIQQSNLRFFLLLPKYPLVSCAACRGLLRLGKGPNAHPSGSEPSNSPRTASLAPAAASLSQKMANGGSTKIRFPLGFARI